MAKLRQHLYGLGAEEVPAAAEGKRRGRPIGSVTVNKKRPQGCAPRAKIWDDAIGSWVDRGDDEVEDDTSEVMAEFRREWLPKYTQTALALAAGVYPMRLSQWLNGKVGGKVARRNFESKLREWMEATRGKMERGELEDEELGRKKVLAVPPSAIPVRICPPAFHGQLQTGSALTALDVCLAASMDSR